MMMIPYRIRVPYTDIRSGLRDRRAVSLLSINEFSAAILIIALTCLLCILVLNMTKTSTTTTENAEKIPLAEELSVYEKLFLFAEEEQSSKEEQSSIEERSSTEEQSSIEDEFSTEEQSSKGKQPSNQQRSTKKEQISTKKQSSKKEQSSNEQRYPKKEQSSIEEQSSTEEHSSIEKEFSTEEQSSKGQQLSNEQSTKKEQISTKMQSSNKEQSSNKQRSTKKEQFSKEKQSSKKEQFSKEKQSSRKEQSSKEKQSSKKEQSSKEKQSSKKEQSSKEKQSSKKEQSSKEKQSSNKEQPSTEQPFTEDQSLPHLTQLPPRYVSPQQWEECKFRIDSLESWREEVCGSSSPVDLRPDMCDDCFNTTVPLLIDAPSVCDVSNSDERLEVLFLISSLHDHFDHRAKIRNNWGDVTANNTANFRLVFLLGTSPNADVMSKVKKEASVFGDMLVGHFNDHYFNLTFKTMMGVNWAVKYCSHASFFTKMDDDVWINIDALLAMLDDFRDDLQEAIGGQCFQRASVKRHEQSKWYVSRQYYPKKLYPPYCYGFAYVGGMAVLEQVFAVSRHVPFFFVDDVYVGMALQQVGFGVIKIPGFTDQGYSCWERDIDNIAVHNASEWQVVSRCTRPAFLEASRPSKHTKDSTPSPQITVKSIPSSQTTPPSKENPPSQVNPDSTIRPLSKYKPSLTTVSSPSRESSSPDKYTFSISISNPFWFLILYFALAGLRSTNIFSFCLKKLWSKLTYLL